MVGGDKLEYKFDSGSPVADLIETKVLVNSIISDAKKGARFTTMDLKDLCLHTMMQDPAYMKVQYKYFPQYIRDRYNVKTKVHNGYIYVKIKSECMH